MNEFDNLLVCLKLSITPEMYEGVENLIDKLEQDKKTYHDQLLETRDRLVRQDYELENKTKALENCDKVLKQYAVENDVLRGMVKGCVDLWI